MLYLEFLEGQGLGNQLWNYVTLRSLSYKLGYDYKIINPENFKGRTFLEISYSTKGNEKHSKNNILESDIKNIFREKLYYDKSLETFACDFDGEINKIQENTIIKGLFQSEKYLFQNNINDFIKIKKLNQKENFFLENHCILNIRGGEYKRFKNLILPKSYWLNSIKNMQEFKSNLKFSIVTDDYDYASALLPNIPIIKGDIYKDFSSLMFAEYVIISNSSFAYFPIKLGKEPKKVIAPSNWARFGNAENKWVSPANYYQNWSYQNHKGELISKETIEESIKKTILIYSSYNVLTTEESLYKKTFFNIFPKKIRRSIKRILSKILPRYIG